MNESDLWGKDTNYIIFTAAKGLWAPGWELDDILNEARVGIWEASLSWKPEGGMSWKTYAVMIARRKVMDLVSRANTQKSRFLRDYTELETSGAYNLADYPPEYNETKQILASLIERVEFTELERNVLELRLLDYNYTEIANRLKVTYKQVDNAQQRILRKLKSLVIPTPETLLSSRG